MSSSRRFPTISNSSTTSTEHTSPSLMQLSAHTQTKHVPTLYSLRGQSWSCFQKFITNIIADDSPYFTTDLRADVQRLDIKDYGLYGLSPSDPGPMVVCNQCSHVMAPEGVARHVKKVHGAKLLSMYKVRPMDGSTISSSGNSSSSSSSSSGIAKSTTMTPPSAATLAAAFSNRLNVSRSSPTLLSAKNTATHGASDVMLTKDDSIDNMLGIALNANLNQMNQVHNSQSAYASSTSSNSSISSSSNSSSSYVKSNREYDPEKHCGVVIGMGRPCTRSLTCKTHQISLRRNVGGRSKPFDQLLAEHRSHVKEASQSAHANKASSKKQAMLGLSSLDNNNQLVLESIDSNSSSSFEMERRSVSSNSNHSIGAASLETILYQKQSSFIGSAMGSDVFLTGESLSQPTSLFAGNAQRKGTSPRMSSTHSSNSKSSTKGKGASRSSGSSKKNAKTITTPTAELTSIPLTMQMEQFDLIDDHGDGLDMGFWEDFDNSPNENNTIGNNTGSQRTMHSSLSQKGSNKRSNAHERTVSDQHNEKKRRGNNEYYVNSNIPRDTKSKSDATDAGQKSVFKHVSQSQYDTSIGRLGVSLNFGNNMSHELSTDDIDTDISDLTIDSILTMQSANNKGISFGNYDTNSDGIASGAHAKRGVHNNMRTVKLGGEPTIDQDIICIDDDDDDNNNLDYATDKNKEESDKKESAPSVSSMSPSKTTSKSKNRHDTESSTNIDLPDALALMTLTTDKSLMKADIATVSKLLAESDHLPASTSSPSKTSTSTSVDTNTTSTPSANAGAVAQPAMSSVPLDENDNYILDIIYKCMRGGNIRNVNPSSQPRTSDTCQSTLNFSGIGIDKEKENAHSDDESVVVVSSSNSSSNNSSKPSTGNTTAATTTATTSTTTTTSTANSSTASSRTQHQTHSQPKPITLNSFLMSKSNGITQLRQLIESTKMAQQQIYQNSQVVQQHNGGIVCVPFGGAGAIALRNNGCYAGNIIGIPCLLGKPSGPPGAATTSLTSSPSKTKKNNWPIGNIALPNAIATAGSGAGVTNAQQATIVNRPNVQQHIRMLQSRTDQCIFPIMPVIHRQHVRTRTFIQVDMPNIKCVQNISKQLQIKLKNSAIFAKEKQMKKMIANAKKKRIAAVPSVKIKPSKKPPVTKSATTASKVTSSKDGKTVFSKDSKATPSKDGKATPSKDGKVTPSKDGKATPSKDNIKMVKPQFHMPTGPKPIFHSLHPSTSHHSSKHHHSIHNGHMQFPESLLISKNQPLNIQPISVVMLKHSSPLHLPPRVTQVVPNPNDPTKTLTICKRISTDATKGDRTKSTGNNKTRSDLIDAEQCVICKTQRRCVVFVDCKHYCVCLACSRRYSATASSIHDRCCPVCRTPITTNPVAIKRTTTN